MPTIFNDASQHRVVTDPAAYERERRVFEFRVCSANRNRVMDGRLYIDDAAQHHRDKVAPLIDLNILYAFPWQNAGTPEQQADYFCDWVGELRPNERVMLDIEDAGQIRDLPDFTRRWLQRVEGRLRTKAAVYLPQSLFLRGLTRDSAIGDRLIKAPRYSGHSARGLAPGWPWDVWQYTDVGPFPGCAQTGDCNYTDLSVEQLTDRLSLAPTAPADAPVGVRGLIAERYAEPGMREILGDPVTPELTCPDGRGKYNHFANGGSLYLNPNTGRVWAIYGAIRTGWASTGWETGPGGYPMGDEIDSPIGRQSNLEHGWIGWNGSTTLINV